MFLILSAFLLVGASLWLLRPAPGHTPAPTAAPGPASWALLFALWLAAAAALGAGLATALALGVLLYRLAPASAGGEPGPAPGAAPEPARARALVATLGGPIMLLGPLVAAAVMAERGGASLIGQVSAQLSLGIGAVGLVALLPLWPLPGGRAAALLLAGLGREAQRWAVPALALSLVWLGLAHGLPLLVLLAAGSALAWPLGVLRGGAPVGPGPLAPRHGLLAAGAWLAALGAHLIAGFWLFALVAPG